MSQANSNLLIRKTGDNSAELLIYDQIGFGGITAKDVADQVESVGKLASLDVRLNSPGGSGFEGIAIYNVLKRTSAKIRIFVDAIAASAAALIAMAADPGELYIADNARMMIHNASAEAGGDKFDLGIMVERLRSLDDVQASTFAGRMNASKQEILDMMSEETWFDADAAVKAGLADKVTKAERIAACANPEALSKFKHVPADLAAQLQKEEPEMTEKEIQAKIESSLKAALDPLRAEHTTAIENLKAEHAAQLAALGKPAEKKDGDGDKGPTEAELLATDRTRMKDLQNLFASAGFKDATVLDGWIEKGTSVLEAKAQVGDLLIKQNKVVGDEHGTEDPADPKAKYSAEYRKDAAALLRMGIDEENFIHSRMVDDGLADLMPGVKAKPAA